jgi:hypothetical protein
MYVSSVIFLKKICHTTRKGVKLGVEQAPCHPTVEDVASGMKKRTNAEARVRYVVDRSHRSKNHEARAFGPLRDNFVMTTWGTWENCTVKREPTALFLSLFSQ